MDLQCEGGKGSGAVYSLMRGVPVITVVRNNRVCVCVRVRVPFFPCIQASCRLCCLLSV